MYTEIYVVKDRNLIFLSSIFNIDQLINIQHYNTIYIAHIEWEGVLSKLST